MRIGNNHAGVDCKGLASHDPSFMQRATAVSKSLRSRSLSRKRSWWFLENVE
jgi:hypothetical protein